jgi:hypothetical protein
MSNSAPSQSSEKPSASGISFDSLHVDGNAAAGMLSEIFAKDLSAGQAKCAGCGTTRPIGTLHVYSHGMGMVVRCPGCDGVVMRLAKTPTHIWLDARGAISIVIEGQS